jgi:heavy metal sensor kinase
LKSIRLSLLIYFLVLLAVALGAASILAYEIAESVLDKATKSHGLDLKKKFEADKEAQQANLDRILRWRATEWLARNAFWQYYEHRYRTIGLHSLAFLSAGTDAYSKLLWPNLWFGGDRQRGFGERPRGPLFDHFLNALPPEFVFAEPPEHESYLPGYPKGEVIEFFEISTAADKKWRSRSMIDHGYEFPFDPEKFRTMEADKPVVDDYEVVPGTMVRRVTFKASMPPPPPRFNQGGRQPRFSDRPSGPEGLARGRLPSPIFFVLIQYAAETQHLQKTLAELQSRFDADVSEFDNDSKRQLSNLQRRLVLISLATFAGTIFGGFLLVRASLAPLQRLSTAVSQVSEKDFRLPIDERQLPRELRPISERLTQTLEQLKRAFAREKQAAADISHELRTPLAALLTTIEVGLRKQRSPEEYREMLEDCHATGLQMSHLVERLLTLARLDAGVDTLRPRTVDISALAEQCAEMVSPLAKAHGLKLTMHRNGPLPVQTDPDKLREVLTNLLHNAIEYNRPGGTIDLSVDQKGDILHLEVRDTGIGIAPAVRQHIFERFYRADSSRQATGLHAGLGLAIVKNYLDLMGGVISVESKEGEGSTFLIELPVGHPTVSRHIGQESAA